MDKFEAQQAFWASFGVPAVRDAVTIPRETQLEWWREYGAYITYEAALSMFADDVGASASIWTRSETWDRADTLAAAVAVRLQNGGATVPYAGGMLWITAGTAFASPMGDPDDDKIKRHVLRVQLHFA